MKIYVAGPMSGHDDFNFPAFHSASKRLREAGHEVFSPAEADLAEWGTLEEVRKKATYRFCLKKDLDWICDNAEGIYLLKGWENSKGVSAELALANALGLEVMYEIP